MVSISAPVVVISHWLKNVDGIYALYAFGRMTLFNFEIQRTTGVLMGCLYWKPDRII